jgi:hypothetical protein
MALSDFCAETFDDMHDNFFEYFERYPAADISVYLDSMISIRAFAIAQNTPPGHEVPVNELYANAAMQTIEALLDACLADAVDEVADYLAEAAKSNDRMKIGLDKMYEAVTSKKNTFNVINDPTQKQRIIRMKEIAAG